jgi:hypothetical protein
MQRLGSYNGCGIKSSGYNKSVRFVFIKFLHGQAVFFFLEGRFGLEAIFCLFCTRKKTVFTAARMYVLRNTPLSAASSTKKSTYTQNMARARARVMVTQTLQRCTMLL